MSPAPVALARRPQFPVPANPGSISGMVARYRASDVSSLADAASMVTWTDASGNGNTLSVLSNAPTKQTVGGLPCVRFTAASSQSMSKNTPTGIPAAGPLTILFVASFASTGGHQVVVEYAGSSNAGWAAGQFGGLTMISNYSNESVTGGAPTAGVVQLQALTLSSNVVTARTMNRKGATDGATGGLFAGTPTRLTLGRADFFPTWALNADVYEVIIYNRLLTAAEYDSLRPYFDSTYSLNLTGNSYNATSYDATAATTDGSGTCVEQNVIYFPSQWNSHKYWMAMVPYGSGSAANENPEMWRSDDGRTWTKVIQIAAGRAGDGNNADPHVTYNSGDSKLYVFWEVQLSASSDGVYWSSSADGSTWSAPVRLITGSWQTLQEPTVRWDGTQWVMFCQDKNQTPNAVTRRTSASLTSGWSAASTVTMTVPGSRGVWHFDVAYYLGRWYMMFSDTDTRRNFWLAVSPDGVNWIVGKRPVMVDGWNTWDGYDLYRPSILPPDDTTTNWRVWYTSEANASSNTYHVGYTDISPAEWPN